MIGHIQAGVRRYHSRTLLHEVGWRCYYALVGPYDSEVIDMPVTLVPLTCPKCGGQISVPNDVTKCFCSFCGTQIIIDDGSTTVHVHNYDEVEMKRLELEQARLEKEEKRQAELAEYRKKWRILLIVYIAIMFVMGYAAGQVKKGAPQFYDVLSMLLGVYTLVGGIALFIFRPVKKAKK